MHTYNQTLFVFFEFTKKGFWHIKVCEFVTIFFFEISFAIHLDFTHPFLCTLSLKFWWREVKQKRIRKDLKKKFCNIIPNKRSWRNWVKSRFSLKLLLVSSEASSPHYKKFNWMTFFFSIFKRTTHFLVEGIAFLGRFFMNF